MNLARTLLFAAKLPRNCWGWAVLCACRLLNALPSIRLNYLTPYELLNKRKPTYKYLRAFGAIAYAKKYNVEKLESRVTKCKLLGYDVIGYIVGVVDSHNKLTGQFFTSRDVTFDERSILRAMDPERCKDNKVDDNDPMFDFDDNSSENVDNDDNKNFDSLPSNNDDSLIRENPSNYDWFEDESINDIDKQEIINVINSNESIEDKNNNNNSEVASEIVAPVSSCS